MKTSKTLKTRKTRKTFKNIVQKLSHVLEEGHIEVDKLNDTQLLREAMREELNAIVLYEQMAEQAIDPRVKILMLDVAREEKVHAEEFEELLERMDPEYEETEDQAEEEIEDLFGPGDED